MNFQERFKGKTSTISKEGIDSLVSAQTNPIKKDTIVSYSSTTQLPRVVSSTSLDNSPKRPRNTTPSVTNGSHASVQIADPSLPTPKSYTPNPASGNLRYRLADFQNQFAPPQGFQTDNKSSNLSFKEDTGLLRRANPLKQRDRPLNRRGAHGIGAKSANQSQVFSEPIASDHSGFNFNPNNFYNQHSQLRASGSNLNGMQRVQPVGGFELKANRNHLHRKSFESLSQQMKQKHISQDVFKNIVKPAYQQFDDESNKNDFSPHRILRRYDSVQNLQRSNMSYNSVPLADMSGLQLAHEPNTIRELSRGDSRYSNNYGDERSPGRASPPTDQVIVLSRLKFRPLSIIEKIDGGGFNGRKVYFKDIEEPAEKRDIITFSRLQESGRPSHINLSNLYRNKPKSMEKARPSWGESI